MNGHFHHDAIEVAYITLAALVGINLLKLAAAWLVTRGGFLGAGGQAIGSLTAL